MSRWIDADHLRKWILSWWERTEPTSEYLKGGDILNQIDREPSIEIIRCGECEYWSGCKSTMHNNHRCSRADEHNLDYWTRADDFCSYGVRKTNTIAEEKPTPIRDYMVHGEGEGE